LYTNVSKKVASLIIPIARKKPKDINSISYSLFGFFLLIKLSIDMIASYTYTKGLIKLTMDINDNEYPIAYNLSKYFLENFGYLNSLDDAVIKDLQDYNRFEEHYKKFDNLIQNKSYNLSMKDVEEKFNSFNRFYQSE
jgi:hypothetical protein